MDEKKDLESANYLEETGVGLRVMKQLLRTPAFKDLLVLSMNDSNPENPRELAKSLLWEDAGLSFSLMGSLPRELNFIIVFLDELAQQLQNVPPEMLRDFVSQMGGNLNKEALKALPRAYAPLVDTLIWEDPQSRKHIRDGAVETMNALMGVFADVLQAPVKKDYQEGDVPEVPVELDPEVLGNLINSLFKWMGTAAGKDPETIRASQEKKIKFLQKAIKTADFGVIRSNITKRGEANYPVSEALVTTMVSDPIIFANVINILPPLVNNLLKGTSASISNLDFPPEILASAVFNLLDDLKAEEIGVIANGLCLFVSDLHEGNMVLGRDEPRFRPVLQNFLQKIFNNLDEAAVADALLALLEDTEVIITVLADVIVEKPELLEKGFSAVVRGFNAQFRGFVHFAEKLSQLSPDLYRHFGRELEENTDFKELGALINALTKLANQVLAENPALLETALSSLYNSVDKEEIWALVQKAVQQGYAFVTKENLFDIKPEEAGRMINTSLASYNRKMARDPQKLQETMSLYLEQLDYEELSLAVLNTSNNFKLALETNPRLSRFIIKSVLSFVSGLVKGSLSSKNWKLLSRSAKGQATKGRRG